MYLLSKAFHAITKAKIIFILHIIAFTSCNLTNKDTTLYTNPNAERLNMSDELSNFRYAIPPVELDMIRQGLVDIQSLDPTIVVELKYSSTDNFLKKDVYEGMKHAYLQPEVASRLVKAQQYLKTIDPELSLIIYDAARPRHVQQKMWDALDLPFDEKIKFLSNPAHGSVHNFGAAVDVSIIDIHGVLLDMGTEFDHLGKLAYPSLEQEMFEDGLLNEYQLANRRLLRQVMKQGGFWGIQTEWWHFNAMTRAEAMEKYEIIE
jgi:zinc D-Ala-D-Ala dipeptidase